MELQWVTGQPSIESLRTKGCHDLPSTPCAPQGPREGEEQVGALPTRPSREDKPAQQPQLTLSPGHLPWKVKPKASHGAAGLRHHLRPRAVCAVAPVAEQKLGKLKARPVGAYATSSRREGALLLQTEVCSLAGTPVPGQSAAHPVAVPSGC